MNTLLRSKYASVVLPTVTTLLLFILWEIIVKIFHIPSFNVPAPSAIWSAAVEKSQPLNRKFPGYGANHYGGF